MKITEMTNDQATNAMIQLAEPFSNICEDEETLELLDKLANASENPEPPIKMIGSVIPKFVLIAFKKHKRDLYQIVSALMMTPIAEVGGMNFLETVNVIRESVDDVLISFFPKFGGVTKSNGNESAVS